jgi:hypothetical protein
MILVYLGVALMVVGVVLDTFFRGRLRGLGHTTAFMRGGAFDYREYHRVRTKRGWAAWPVYVMWGFYIVGVISLFVGFFVDAGILHS